MKKAFFLLYEKSHFTELLRLARLLKQDQQLEPIFFFSRMLVFSSDLAKICQAEGFACLDSEGYFIDLASAAIDENAPQNGKKASVFINPNQSGTNPSNKRGSAGRRFDSSFFKFLPFLIKKIPAFFEYKWDQIKRIYFTLVWLITRTIKIPRFLDEHNVSLLIMAEDNVFFDTAIWIKSGHQRKILSIIIPFTISNPLEQAESALYDFTLRIDSPIKKAVRFLYPRWEYTHKSTPLLRLPWYEVLAREWLHLAPPNPWMLNSGGVDAIAVESPAMYEYYSDGGLPATTLRITGALADDQLAEVLHHRDAHTIALVKELNLDPSLPILLIALPPNQFPRSCEFNSYPDLIRFFGETALEIKNWNVLIRPHPKQTPHDMDAISFIGNRITWKDTASLIPLCSIYVASASATIRWAIGCGIPVINYDVYQYHYLDYMNIPGVLYADKYDKYLELLTGLTNNKIFYDKILGLQQPVMQNWGLLDGKSGHRILDLIYTLASHENRRFCNEKK